MDNSVKLLVFETLTYKELCVIATVIAYVLWPLFAIVLLIVDVIGTGILVTYASLATLVAVIWSVIVTVRWIPYLLLAAVPSVVVYVTVTVAVTIYVTLKAILAVLFTLGAAAVLVFIVRVLHTCCDQINDTRITYGDDHGNSCDDSKRGRLAVTVDMKMPTKRYVSIELPASRCSCKTLGATELVPLVPGLRQEYQLVVDEMNDTIRRHSAKSYAKHQIISIHKVKNCCLWTRFLNRQSDVSMEGYDVNQRLLFHGSAVAEDIVRRGFDERYSQKNGMFGAGVYFAQHSSKSNQYVFGPAGTGCPAHSRPYCTICER